MRRLLRCIALTVSALCLAASAAGADVRLPSIPRLPSGSRALGRIADSTPLRLTVALAPRDPLALAAYAQAVSTPGSPSYHQYLTVAEFAERFGPSDSAIAAVQDYLRSRGLSPGRVASNHLSIPVNTTAGPAARAFSVGLERYALPNSRTGFSSTSAPAVASAVAAHVQGVLGLSNVNPPHPAGIHRLVRAHVAGGHVATGGPQPCAGASSGHGYTADQIASAYGLSGLYSSGGLGAGQTIAVYELEPFSSNDIQAYQACYGTSASVTTIPIDGGAGSGSGQGEAALDIEDVIGLVPRARILVYSGPNSALLSNRGPYDTYAKFVSDNQARVLTTSWGQCEGQEGRSDASAENTLFQEAAVQGQSIVAASGDAGAEDCTTLLALPSSSLAVDDPASQPFVTGVGGTTLPVVGPPPRESVWNNSYGATGGGISTLWTMPSYQSQAAGGLGVINSASSRSVCGSASSYCREVPDVSADADPTTGYAVYFQGSWGAAGGTSAASPTIAALLTLINGSSGCAGAPVGFANAALYRAAGAVYGSAFNDVVLGNNDLTGDGGFSATAGYDMATGLGTPNGAALATAMCDRVSLTVPGSQSGIQGQSASVTARAVSSTGQRVSYSASGLPPGLTINSGTGMISGTLATSGSYTAAVVARDGYGSAAAGTIRWLVGAPTVSLTQLRNQRMTVGRRVTFRLRGANVNNGRALSFTATGLPRGLSINRRTGVISGVLRRTGKYHVTVRAVYGTASRTVRFTWTVTRRRHR